MGDSVVGQQKNLCNISQGMLKLPTTKRMGIGLRRYYCVAGKSVLGGNRGEAEFPIEGTK